MLCVSAPTLQTPTSASGIVSVRVYLVHKGKANNDNGLQPVPCTDTEPIRATECHASAVVSARVVTNRMARGKVRGKGEQTGPVVEDVRGNRREN